MTRNLVRTLIGLSSCVASVGCADGNIGPSDEPLEAPTFPDSSVALTAPALLTAHALSSSAIQLRWNDVTGESGYYVERSVSASSGFVRIASPPKDAVGMTDSGLAANTTYSYRVQARKVQGNRVLATGYSNVASTTTLQPGTTAPTAPSNLLASAVSSTQIRLSWQDTSGNESGFKIERCQNVACSSFAQIASTGAGTTSFDNVGLSPATSYSYRVRAYNTVGDSAYVGPVSAQTQSASDTTPPLVSMTAPVSGSRIQGIVLLTVSASDNVGVSRVDFYRDGATLLGSASVSPYTFSWSTASVADGAHALSAKALDSAGNVGSSANVSATVDNLPPSIPGSFQASPATCSQVSLAWSGSSDGVSGVAGYRIYRNNLFLKQVSATSTLDAGLSASTSYTYAVTAIDNMVPYHESARSPSISVTTPACADTTPPSLPTGLTASATSCSQINLAWSASTDTGGSGLAGYKVFRGGVQIGTSGTPSYADTSGLSASTSYSYSVSATDNAGNTSAKSPSVNATTTACPITGGSHLFSGRIGGSGNDVAYRMARAGNNDILVTGNFSNTVDFGGGPRASAGNTDGFVVKYDSSGARLWDRTFGGTSSENPQALAVDTNGDVLVTGYFLGASNFGASAGLQDVFVAKYSGADGSPLWSKRFGAQDSDVGYGIAIDPRNNDIVVTGQFQWTVSFGGTSLVSHLVGAPDIFLAKYSSDGIHLWSKAFSDPSATVTACLYGCSTDRGKAVAVAPSGSIALIGEFMSRINLGGSTLTGGSFEDVFIAELSSAGQHLWSRRLGNTGTDYGSDVAFDSLGNVIAIGMVAAGNNSAGSIDFGGGLLPSLGGTDVFVAKYASGTGAHVFSKRMGGFGSDMGYGVAVDAANNVLVTGYFGDQGNGIANFGGADLQSTANGSGTYTPNVFVAKYSAAGTHAWSKAFGGSGHESGVGIVADAAGNVWASGSFQGSVNFGGGALTAAATDVFLLKLAP